MGRKLTKMSMCEEDQGGDPLNWENGKCFSSLANSLGEFGTRIFFLHRSSCFNVEELQRLSWYKVMYEALMYRVITVFRMKKLQGTFIVMMLRIITF